jgi:hypothetical protein
MGRYAKLSRIRDRIIKIIGVIIIQLSVTDEKKEVRNLSIMRGIPLTLYIYFPF